jgi:regulator of sigma E protease
MKLGRNRENPGISNRLSKSLGSSRATLAVVALPFLLAAMADYPVIESALRYVYMILGFSALIFVHELGHFLVARACGVKCPVFSVGMGHRLCGWRKGVGFTFGPEAKDIENNENENRQAALGDDNQQTATGDRPLENKTTVSGANTGQGQTDYRISMLPIGGYVRMLGQDDMDPTKRSSDPASYNNKPIWQRMCIISAGVIMNIIFAVIIFAVVFHVGIDRPGATIGRVQYGSPAEKAGLQLGDHIVAAGSDADNDRMEFMDIMISSALSDGHTPIHYRWRTYDAHTLVEKDILPTVSDSTGLLMIGVAPIPDLKLLAMTPKEHDEFAQLSPEFASAQSGDRITAVDGQEVKDYVQLYRAVQASQGKPIHVTLESKDRTTPQTITVTPKLQVRDGVEEADAPAIAGFIPRTIIEGVIEGSAAEKEKFQRGDIILRINEVENPTVAQTKAAINANPENKINVKIERLVEGKPVQLTLSATPHRTAEGAQLGAFLGWDCAHPVIAGVAGDRPDLKNVIPGSQIVKIDGQDVHTWHEVLSIVRHSFETASSANAPAAISAPVAKILPVLQLSLKAPDSDAVIPLNVRLTDADLEDTHKMEYNLGVQLDIKTELQKSSTIAGAVSMGLDDTRKFILQTYMTLRGLIFAHTVPASQLHGALGIAKVGHDIQERGFIHLLFLLGVISVNLAVANFLPLPIVDGGHFLLLIVEKIRGKRLAPKVELTIQYVGLFLIIGMLLFVTYNDLGLFMTKK